MDVEAAVDDHTSLKQSVLHVDVYRIDQVIRNLIYNAIKNIEETGVITISFVLVDTVTSFNAANHTSEVIGVLRIMVIDDGKGKIHPMILQEFGQIIADAKQSNYETGLGLWICHKIVTLHHGSMRYSSEGHGKGSTFIVELPLFAKVNFVF